MKLDKLEHPQAFLECYAPLLHEDSITAILMDCPVLAYGFSVDDGPVAVICGICHEITLEITDCYVMDGYRNQGHGATLLNNLYWDGLLLTQASFLQVDFALLPRDTMDGLAQFFLRNGFVTVENSEQASVMEFRVADFRTSTKKDGGVLPFSQLPAMHIQQILTLLEVDAMPDTTDMDLSRAIIHDTQVKAFLWVEALTPDTYRIAMLHNSGTNAELMHLLTNSMEHAKSTLPSDTLVLVELYQDSSLALMNKLTGNQLKPSRRFFTMVRPL